MSHFFTERAKLFTSAQLERTPSIKFHIIISKLKITCIRRVIRNPATQCQNTKVGAAHKCKDFQLP